MPRYQPSIRAREKIQASAVAQAVRSRRRQGRRSASAGPYATTAAATVRAAGVPGPTCGFQEARSGGHWAWSSPLDLCHAQPTPQATATSSAPTPAATRSGRWPARPAGAAGSSAGRLLSLRSSVFTPARYARGCPGRRCDAATSRGRRAEG